MFMCITNPNSCTRYTRGAWAQGAFLRQKLQQEENSSSSRNFVENDLMFMCITNQIIALDTPAEHELEELF